MESAYPKIIFFLFLLPLYHIIRSMPRIQALRFIKWYKPKAESSTTHYLSQNPKLPHLGSSIPLI